METRHVSGYDDLMKSGCVIINKRVSWEEVHKLQEMINHLILNKSATVTYVLHVLVTELSYSYKAKLTGGDVLLHNSHKCLCINPTTRRVKDCTLSPVVYCVAHGTEFMALSMYGVFCIHSPASNTL
jgi:hypothetical protein